MEKMRFGVIGTGKIARQFAEAAAAIGGEITAVLSRKRETGEAYARSVGGGTVFVSRDDFFASHLFDAVYIASPNSCHAKDAHDAIMRGYHVLLEKPATATATECEALFALAEEKGVVLLEAMRPLHDPLMPLLEATLPRIGKLRRVDFEYCQYSSRYDAFRSGVVMNAFDPSLANAAVMDIGVYTVAMTVALLGAPERILSHSIFLDNHFEASGMAILDYPDAGYQATVSYSKIIDSAAPSVITGEEGSILIDRLSGTKRVTLALRGEEPIALDYSPAENNMVYEIADFVKMTQGELSQDRYRHLTCLTMRVLDRIREESGVVFARRASDVAPSVQ